MQISRKVSIITDENGEILGYFIDAGGVYHVYDANGNYITILELGLEEAISPFDLLGGIATIARSILKAGVKGAYKVAKSGDRHSGFYKDYLSRSVKEIQKGIRSFQKRIQEHKEYIKNPREAFKKYNKGDWDKLDPRQQEDLIKNKWPKDIKRLKEQLEILKGILNEK